MSISESDVSLSSDESAIFLIFLPDDLRAMGIGAGVVDGNWGVIDPLLDCGRDPAELAPASLAASSSSGFWLPTTSLILTGAAADEGAADGVADLDLVLVCAAGLGLTSFSFFGGPGFLAGIFGMSIP